MPSDKLTPSHIPAACYRGFYQQRLLFALSLMSLTFHTHISSHFTDIPPGWDFQKYFSDSEVQVSGAFKLSKQLWLHGEHPASPNQNLL